MQLGGGLRPGPGVLGAPPLMRHESHANALHLLEKDKQDDDTVQDDQLSTALFVLGVAEE